MKKDLVLTTTEYLAKVVDVVLYGSDGASEASLNDISLVSDGDSNNVITGLVSSNGEIAQSGSSDTLWVVLGMVGASVAVLIVVLACSKRARYKVGRFFSEMFAGIFGKKKAN